MTTETPRNTDNSFAAQFMLEAFFEGCDPQFSWDVSGPCGYGDHPDLGGGVEEVDIEGCTLEAVGDLDRQECVALFGERFIALCEAHALKNHETYYCEGV